MGCFALLLTFLKYVRLLIFITAADFNLPLLTFECDVLCCRVSIVDIEHHIVATDVPDYIM